MGPQGPKVSTNFAVWLGVCLFVFLFVFYFCQVSAYSGTSPSIQGTQTLASVFRGTSIQGIIFLVPRVSPEECSTVEV